MTTKTESRCEPGATETGLAGALPLSLCAAMALQFAAGGAVIPFVTLLLRDRGLDLGRISQVFSASSATLVVFPFLWGILADRWIPLNRLFTLLNLLAAAALAAFAAGKNFTALLISFTLFSSCLNPLFTLINALSFHHLPNPRAQFGLLRAWGSLGWIVPFLPISVWILLAQNPRLDFALYLGIALCLSMALLSLWLPHTPPGARRQTSLPTGRGVYLPAMKKLLCDADYLILLISMFLVAGSYSLLTYYSPPLLEECGVPRFWIGPVQSIGVICEFLFFQGQRAFLLRWNYTGTMLVGCAALLARHLLFSTASSVWILCASYVLSGMVIVFYHIGISMLVNALSAPEVRATAQTLLVLLGSGGGPLFSNALAGPLAAHFGNSLRPVFLFAAGLAGVAACLLLLRGSRLNHPQAVS